MKVVEVPLGTQRVEEGGKVDSDRSKAPKHSRHSLVETLRSRGGISGIGSECIGVIRLL